MGLREGFDLGRDLSPLSGESSQLPGQDRDHRDRRPNACGKSTLLRALARVLAPRDGVVLLDEQPVGSYPAKRFAARVGLLAQKTEILLLDEPTSFLDMAHQVEVMNLCLRLNLTREITVVAVLHDLNQAARYADHLIAMKAGQVMAQGHPVETIISELVADAFGLEARVVNDPVTGTPMIVPAQDPRADHS